MNEVSCRAFLPLFRALDTRGLPRAKLVEGLDVPLDRLERPGKRVDWEVYVGVSERLAAIAGPDELRGVIRAMYGMAAFDAVVAAISLVASPTSIYTNIFSFVGPSLFNNVVSTIEVVDPRRVRITLEIPPPYVECPSFFECCAGGFEAAPTVCGYAAADVRLQATGRRGVYDISVDPTRSALARLRERLRRVFSGGHALAELELQRDELRRSFDALRVANEESEKQRRLAAAAEEARRTSEAERALLEERLHRAQKLEGIGLLAGGVAHDFNNLLTAIIGNAELALAALPADAPGREHVHGIEQLAARAADLTGQLLAYAGRRPPAAGPLDLDALVGEMGELLRTAVPRHVALRVDLAGGLPAVAGDRGQLQQVVMNLITNAAEAGGDTVWIRTRRVHATRERLARSWLQTDAPEGAYVEVVVRDEGAGMDADTLARIFDPFFTTKAAGRGLGLSAVLGIVKGHGAVLEVETGPGRGTTFAVLFPALEAPAPAPAPDPEPEQPWRVGGTVLVADDEAAVRHLCGEHLRALGFEVLLAADGVEAVEAVRRHRVRLVILDRTMPRMSGEATFRELRRLQPDARVILSSGYEDEQATRALFAEGLAATLKKPYRKRELIATVRRVLEG